MFRSKKRAIRYGLVTANIALFIGVASFIMFSQPSSGGAGTQPALNTNSSSDVSNPLDTLSSADIAVNIALLVQLDQTVAITNNADSVNMQLSTVPADSQVVSKPQIVNTESKSINDLQTYVAVEGDTVTSISERFGVSIESVRWSNDLAGDTVAVGTELKIPPVDGFVYTVKADDTAESLASRYSSQANKIIAFNDAEIDGLQVGQVIVIPGGSVPAPARPVINTTGFRFGSSAIYGYNGYDYGYCTWYAANRRADIGRPIPANLGNASTWRARAQLAGIPVGNTPQAGAIIWTPPRDYYGHVGFVEEVYSDGSVRISEMNTRGWGVRSEKVLTPAQAAGYSYIY